MSFVLVERVWITLLEYKWVPIEYKWVPICNFKPQKSYGQ